MNPYFISMNNYDNESEHKLEFRRTFLDSSDEAFDAITVFLLEIPAERQSWTNS